MRPNRIVLFDMFDTLVNFDHGQTVEACFFQAAVVGVCLAVVVDGRRGGGPWFDHEDGCGR
jgi:hypothetical protein